MKSPTPRWFLASLVAFGCGGNNNPAPVVDTAPEPDIGPDTPFGEGGGTTLDFHTEYGALPRSQQEFGELHRIEG